MLSCTTLEAMNIWGELVECYYDVHGYGGDTAEIYSYRLEPYTPTAHNSSNESNSRLREVSYNAAKSLALIIKEFCHAYGCKAEVDEVIVEEWDRDICNYLSHRYHARIIK